MIFLGAILLRLKTTADVFPITFEKAHPLETGATEAETSRALDRKYALMFAVGLIMISSFSTLLFSHLAAWLALTERFSSDAIYFLSLLGFVIGLISTPGSWAVLMRWKVSQEGFKDAGLQLSPLKWYGLAVLCPLLMSSVPYGILWALDLYIPETWKEYYQVSAFIPPPSLKLIGHFLFLLLAAFGEELGWRSYLQPKLTKQFGFYRGIFLVALVWWLWHIPGDLIQIHHLGTPINLQASTTVLFLTLRLMVIAAYSFILGHLYNRSGSVFTVTLMHASLNAVNLCLTVRGDIGETVGAAVIAAVWMLGAYLLLRKQDYHPSAPDVAPASSKGITTG